MSWLTERMEDRLRVARAAQTKVLVGVAVVVLLRLVTHVATGAFLMMDEIPLYRVSQVVGSALAAVLDVLLLALVWTLFQTMGRVERESERMQTFMDNVYRKMLPR